MKIKKEFNSLIIRMEARKNEKDYETMQEDMENMQDLLEVSKRMNEPNIPAAEVYAQIEKKWK